MVVEDQAAPWAKSSASGRGKVRNVRRDGGLGEAAEHAERGHAVALGRPGAVGRRSHDAGHLAAGHERQRRA